MSANTPRLVSDTHGLMALGSVSATLAATRTPDGLVSIPEPPAWFDLWAAAVERTRPDALKDLREQRIYAPTPNEKLEVESVAQAHYEAYARLAGDEAQQRTGGFVAWEAIPDERRMLMMAVVADMIASGFIHVGPQAAHPKGSRELWVVMTNRPGPGSKALIDEVRKRMVDEMAGEDTPAEMRDLVAATLTVVEKQLAVEASEFVEVEDTAGVSHGFDRGLKWEHHGDGRMWRIGPFPAGVPRLTPREAAEVYLWAVGDGGRAGEVRDDEARHHVGKGLTKLIDIAAAELGREAVDLGDDADDGDAVVAKIGPGVSAGAALEQAKRREITRAALLEAIHEAIDYHGVAGDITGAAIFARLMGEDAKADVVRASPGDALEDVFDGIFNEHIDAIAEADAADPDVDVDAVRVVMREHLREALEGRLGRG